VDPPRNELSQAHEGMGTSRGRIRVVQGGRGGRLVREEELLSWKFEARIRWDNPRNREEVVRLMEGKGGSVITSWTRGMAELAKAVMALWRYVGFLTLSAADRQSRLKKRYGCEVILPRATRGARWGEKVGTDLGKHAKSGFTSGGGQISLRPARQRWWHTRTGRGGRQASLSKHVELVVVKQLVIHLQTRHQKVENGFMMVRGDSKQQTRTRILGQKVSVPGRDKGGGEAHARRGEAANRG